jgi:hypothetical protein
MLRREFISDAVASVAVQQEVVNGRDGKVSLGIARKDSSQIGAKTLDHVLHRPERKRN